MKFGIVKNKKKFFALSLILIAIGIVSMIINAVGGKGALNFDIDFTGGTAIVVDMEKEFSPNDVEDLVSEVTGQSSPQVQRILGTTQVSIKIQSVDSDTRTALTDALISEFSVSSDSILSVSDISGTVSGEMQKKSMIAVAISCLVMLIYISIRFKDFKMGLSSIIALVHDVFIMISFYAIFRVPVNTAFIAALLTVVGYSINSTIVIFDRVRENRKTMDMSDTEAIVDISVWQTMRRSVYTSLTTFFTIFSLYIFGVQSVKQFALPIIVGVVSGAYSSVFISGSLWQMMYAKFGETNYDDYYEHEKTDVYVDPYYAKDPKKYK